MGEPDSTRWTMIRKAAAGLKPDREDFAAVYEPALRAYYAARWRGTPFASEIDDAVQEVFVEFLEEGGALSRVESGRPGGFRAYLYGVARNVALNFERRRAHRRDVPGSLDPALDSIASDEARLSTVFERAWAEAIVREAAERQRERAREKGPAAERRVELLRLRFTEGLPIREIARLWGEDPARVHHEYATAREEYKAALLEVVSLNHPGTPEQLEEECRRIHATLS